MPFQDIADLARTIAITDVGDENQLRQVLHQLQEVWRGQSAEGSTAEIDGYFETATELAQVLAQDRPMTVEEVLTLITRLIARVECAVARAGLNRKPGGVVLKLSEQAEASDLSLTVGKAGPSLNDMALGALLVQMGVLDDAQVAAATEVQRNSDMRTGDAIVHLGFATPEQVREVADLQKHLRDHSRTWKPAATANETRDVALVGETTGSEHCATLLGEILVKTGSITREQLNEGLKVRRATGLRIGEALVQIGACEWPAIRKAVRAQESMRQSTASAGPVDRG